MRTIILTLMFIIFPLTSFAENIQVEKVGGLSAHLEPTFLDAYVYKICVNNYEYVAMKRTTGTGGVAIIQSYERVVDNKGNVIALPKMCSVEDNIH